MANPKVRAAFERFWLQVNTLMGNKQDKIDGTEGQLISFNAENAVIAIDTDDLNLVTTEDIDRICGDLSSGGSAGETKEVTYTYDGDIDSDDNIWAISPGGLRTFLKVADIPNGEINLSGGVVSVIATNVWQNHEYTITDEMLNETVNVDGVDIKASVNGLTQIFYQHAIAGESGPNTNIIVCTRPGSYDIAFDTWMSILNFPEKGIYFLDGRGFGGSKYVASLTCTVTTTSGETEETEEINYTYDGDNESDAHTWVNLPDGSRYFVKVADMPNEGIDLTGSKVTVLVPEWPQNNYSFTITREMYSEVNGLTQILYQDSKSNDQSPIAMIIICTIPGEYIIAMNGWDANLQFSETGIYFMDGRASWQGKYVESLIRSETTNSEETKENPIEYSGNEIQVFSRGLCIGDSITEGVFNHTDGQIVVKKYSYPSVLKRMTGIEIVNAGVGGLTSKTWYEASLNSDSQYGTWVNGEWVWHMAPETSEGDVASKSLDYSGFDFAIIHLGINDIGMMGDATLDDMVAIFETNINNIINKLKTANTGIKVFLATIIPAYAVPGYTAYEMLNEKIRSIANATEDVFLIDLNLYSECHQGTPYQNWHLTAIGYRKMAAEIESLISYTIN
jgi:lysophospholipase L1-like esterase